MKRLTSLLLVEERLFEVEYFALSLAGKQPLELQYCLNAFLSAARSVTFLIQKELRHVEGFDTFWASVQENLRSDASARFFLELRNFSQKEGRVSLKGWGGIAKPSNYQFPQELGEEPYILYFFAKGHHTVPDEVARDDLVVACLKHSAKLARLVLDVMERFPFDSCPARACSVEGARHLDLELSDFLEISGFPRNWVVASAEIPAEDAFKVVASSFDAIDVAAIRSIADYSNLTTGPNLKNKEIPE